MERRCLFALAGILSFVSAFGEPVRIDRPINAVEPAEKATCNPQTVGPCLLTFFADFGFHSQAPDEKVFDETLHEYVIRNGVAGWSQVRGRMNALYNCSGGQQNFDLCLPWQQSMNSFNMTREEALAWDVRFRTLEYQVGGGYDVLTHNWYCINEVDRQEGPFLEQCAKTFRDEQHNQPNQTCEHISEYLVCVQRPYAANCGSIVGAFACSYERIVYQVVYPECADHVAFHCQGAPSAAPELSQLANARSKNDS
uniref:Uncharacterized protein n=1 Tax=Plectus sambesii TaxID=2011161 RepID=A0A914XFP3_9BILA